MTASSRALLVCAGGGIGDSLLASLVARALRSKFTAIDALTLPGHESTLERVPDIDRVLLDAGEPDRELAEVLRRESYAAAVITWATPRTARIPQLAGIPVRVGQARRLYSWMFTHRVTVRSEDGDVTTHWSQILLDYARALGCDTTDTQPHLIPTPDDEREAELLLNEMELRIGGFAIVHPTNAIAPLRGNWPTQGWAELVRAIRAAYHVPVLISGSQSDMSITEEIARLSDTVSIAGQLSIGGFGSLARHAKVFAGITTGSMHVAAAVGCPTVGIFPFQTDTPDRWAPLGLHTAIVRASYPCRAGERKETCPDYACIANLDVPRILNAIDSLVSVASA